MYSIHSGTFPEQLIPNELVQLLGLFNEDDVVEVHSLAGGGGSRGVRAICSAEHVEARNCIAPAATSDSPLAKRRHKKRKRSVSSKEVGPDRLSTPATLVPPLVLGEEENIDGAPSVGGDTDTVSVCALAVLVDPLETISYSTERHMRFELQDSNTSADLAPSLKPCSGQSKTPSWIKDRLAGSATHSMKNIKSRQA